DRRQPAAAPHPLAPGGGRPDRLAGQPHDLRRGRRARRPRRDHGGGRRGRQHRAGAGLADGADQPRLRPGPPGRRRGRPPPGRVLRRGPRPAARAGRLGGRARHAGRRRRPRRRQPDRAHRGGGRRGAGIRPRRAVRGPDPRGDDGRGDRRGGVPDPVTATAPLRPADALDRIVYLLDRALAERTKVRAFLRARDVVAEVGDEEVERLHAAGRLAELPGSGPTTAGVIAEALEGRVPSYVARVEEEPAIDPGEGAELRAALRGDCHTHSTWSDGGAPIERMARTAMALGHEYMVLTDHSPRLTVAHGLSAARLRAQLDEVAELNERLAPFRILTGIEVDILEDGSLDQDEDLLARLDVVVASVHSKLRMERREMTERMVRAIANPHVDILGHCTGRKVVGRGRPPSTFD